MIAEFDAAVSAAAFDVCVVGSGPVGLALSLALERRGSSVLLLESGGPAPRAASEAAPAHRTGRAHAPSHLCMCRAFGGTSHWWGGRCVPLDDVDFDPRPGDEAGAWPIGADALAPFHDEACRFFGLPPGPFAAPRIVDLPRDISFDTLERWAPTPNMADAHRAHVMASRRITALTGATVVGLDLSEARDRVTALRIWGPNGPAVMRPRRVVLACGALETTRLLLLLQRETPGLFSDALGRFYMGHLSGEIASLTLARPEDARHLDYYVEGGAFARRRLTIARERLRHEGLLNISFWADNPPFHDHAHRSGALSLVWLALKCAPLGQRILPEAIRLNHVGPAGLSIAPHLRNIVAAPARTARDVASILQARVAQRPRAPGFLMHTRAGAYALHYHAEQSANPQSRVQLSRDLDERGVPLLDVDLRFLPRDTQSVVAAHGVLAKALSTSGWARLAYFEAEERREASVLAQAQDGFHQIGVTRMGDDAAHSVVDRDCRVHGMENLYIASSAVFPTSGQANPTFPAVALAIRLASRLAAQDQTSRATLSARSLA